MNDNTVTDEHLCERCSQPILDGQPVTAWVLGLTGQFEHVTCPETDAVFLARRGGA